MLFLFWFLASLCPVYAVNGTLEMSDILKELSWGLKLQIWKGMSPSTVEPTTRTTSGREAMFSSSTLNPAPPTEAKIRRVDIQYLRASMRGNYEEDETDMRLKLFRLMYETVRDSDLKVKRAELIKEHYVNSSSFDIGYLIGDIVDKANIITDVSVTLQRFRRDWKPIEHINAYEQISNQAIEITHLIGLVRALHKKEPRY